MVIFDSVVVFYGKRGCPRPEDRGQGSEPEGRGRSWRHRVPCPGAPAPSCPLPLLSVNASPFSRPVPLLFLFFCPLPVWSCVLASLGSCEVERRPPPCTRRRSPASEQGFSPRGPPGSSGLLRTLGAGHRTWRHVRLHAVLRAASAPVFIGILGAFRTRRGNTHCFGSWSKTKRGNVPPRKTGCYSYKRLKNKGL